MLEGFVRHVLQGKEVTSDDFNRLQDSLELVLKFIGECPIIDGRHIENIALTAGITETVNHKLGRISKGATITYQSAAGSPVEIDGFTTESINLTSGANMTVSVWVF